MTKTSKYFTYISIKSLKRKKPEAIYWTIITTAIGNMKSKMYITCYKFRTIFMFYEVSHLFQLQFLRGSDQYLKVNQHVSFFPVPHEVAPWLIYFGLQRWI